MKVNISGILYNYIPDFDPIDIQSNIHRNWRVAAGDYFKFPVTIGTTDCFIKRFAKSGKDISGYDFLLRIKGKKQEGLPIIHDVVSTKEEGKEVVYLFTEYIAGDTLDALQRNGFTFLPIKLATDLFCALKIIHNQGFWFPDFDPKNFLRSAAGDFYIIDLDSTYPVSVLPQQSVYGSRDYWAPVYNFYKQKSGFTNDQLRQLKGDTFNMLHLVYFISLYSFYLFGDGEDLSATSIEQLNEYLTRTHRLFLSTMQYSFYITPQSGLVNQNSLTPQIFSSLVNTCLFPQQKEPQYISNTSKIISLLSPDIHFFIKDDTDILVEGETYTLQWNVTNATSLLVDNILSKYAGSKSLVANKNTTHVLKAINGKNGVVKTAETSITITVEKEPEINLSLSKTTIRSGESIKLSWQVKNGINISILQNGAVIASNCKPAGSLVQTPKWDDRKSNPQNFIYKLQTYTSSGARMYYSAPDLTVSMAKKDGSNGYIIALVIVAIIAIMLAVKYCSPAYSSYDTTTTDSTATATDTTMPSSDTTYTSMADTSAMMALATPDSTAADADTTSLASGKLYDFADDFNDNTAGWAIYSDDNTDAAINDGNITVKTSDTTNWSSIKNFSVDIEKDFNLSARIGWGEGDDSTRPTYGLVFCDNTATNSFFYFCIKPDGDYYIFRYADEEWTAIAQDASSFIRKGAYYNTLSIKKENNDIDFYINGYDIKTLPFTMTYGNGFGIRADRAQPLVYFDSFTISGSALYTDDKR